jgi:CBS domain-containing protein
MCSQSIRIDEIKEWKETRIKQSAITNEKLNECHDEIMKQVFHIVLEEYTLTNGSPPCEFVWFVTGSAGRLEQGIFSDQDHGIIYEENNSLVHQYFLTFGEKLSDALNEVGYPYCEGKVMSSNPLWCKSVEEWKMQLLKWMEMENWESIRYLQIFYDCRKIYGEQDFVFDLRSYIHEYRFHHPSLLKRFMNNVMRIKKGVGLFGQFFVERTGPHRGSIHIKNTMYLPYVNSIRLLAIKEGLQATSTIGRIALLRELKQYESILIPYETFFMRILEYRIALFREVKTYSDVHFLNIKSLTKEERQEIKVLLRNGIKLYQQVQRIIEKGC